MIGLGRDLERQLMVVELKKDDCWQGLRKTEMTEIQKGRWRRDSGRQMVAELQKVS